jgi:hypothetical protein
MTFKSACAIVAGLTLAAASGRPAQAVDSQTQFQNLPMCSAPPSDTDAWPVAATDTLGPTGGALTFTSGALTANDLGVPPLAVSFPPESQPQSGGTITGSDPFTYTPPAGYTGNDVFTYTLTDAAGHKIVGLVKVAVVVDTTAPSVSITAPSGGTVSGAVQITAAASDNVAVAGVRFLDGSAQVGAEITSGAYQTTWDTTLVADGSHTLTAIARDAAGNTRSSAPIVVTVNNRVTVPAVTGMLQADAQAAITGASLVPSVSTAPSGTVQAGKVISQNPGGNTTAPRNSTVAIVVSTGAAAATPTVDKMIFSDGANKRTTAAFSTTNAGDVLVAFAASDGPAGANGQTLTISGAGLTWTRVKRAALEGGVSEIWTANASGLLTNATVSSTQTLTGYHQSLTVIAFSGAAGIGASNIGGAANGAPSVGLTPTAAGSAVYAVGNDWDKAVARTVPSGQTKVHESVDTPVGDTFWVQSLNGTTASAATPVTLNASQPTTDQWNMAIVELLAGAPAPTVNVPSILGMTQAAAQSAITGAQLTLGTVTSANSTAYPAGQVMSQTPGGNTAAAQGSAVSFVMSLGPSSTTSPTVGATVSVHGAGTRTTAPFSASAGDVLVAFAASDGPAPPTNSQALTISGAGLTWTRVQNVKVQGGVAEIWTATTAGALTNATVTSTQAVATLNGAAVTQSLTVIAFSGASGVGASAVGNAASGATSLGLNVQAGGSLVFGVGVDYDKAAARTVPAGQTKVDEFLAPSGDTFWVQRADAATSGAGASVTLNDTAPTTDQWNFAIVEIKR